MGVLFLCAQKTIAEVTSPLGRTMIKFKLVEQ